MELDTLFSNWTIFGPIENPGFFPGSRAWQDLPLDAAKDIPAEMKVDGNVFQPVPAQMTHHCLNFRRVFPDYPIGAPQAYAFCAVDIEKTMSITLCMDADWGTIIWLDGKEIIDTRNGNPSPIGFYPSRANVTLTPGRHVFCVRIISGCGGWTLHLCALPSSSTGSSRPSYLEAGLRLEERPAPNGKIGSLSTEDFEQLAATCGVEARWISIFDQNRVDETGKLFYNSEFLFTGHDFKPEYEPNLKKWVDTIHALNLPVVSWCSMTHNYAAWKAKPEWRQVYLVDQTENVMHENIDVCVNTPYGQALIQCCLEAIEKFDLDGFWFDGSAMSNVWTQPFRVSCVCPYCNELYEKATGNKAPTAYTPDTMEFRQWMNWRYQNFSDYWLRITQAIKSRFPHAVVAINHYHREHIPWTGAVPLNPFGKDIISATEADGDPWKAALYTRINRAYERPYSETWITSSVGRYTLNGLKQHNPYPLITQAVSCLTAGADSSFGGVDLTISAAAYSELSQEIRPRKPYRYLPSYPYLAYHVSQQSATYTFGTNPNFIKGAWKDHYWKALVGWHRLLISTGLWMDVRFDDHLTSAALKDYPVFISPFAVALSDAQLDTILDYIKQGGTFITGPYFAAQDEWGFAVDRTQKLADLLPLNLPFPAFDTLDDAMISDDTSHTVKNYGTGQFIQFKADLGSQFRDNPTAELAQLIESLFDNQNKPVPFRLTNKAGQKRYAHIGISYDHDGSIIVAIQQLEPFWQATAAINLRPPLVHDAVLQVVGEDVRQACALIPESFPLTVTQGKHGLEIHLPPYTWGTTIRLVQ